MNLTPEQRKVSYIILSITWLAIAINFLFPFPIAMLSTALYWTGIVMAAAHLVEVLIFSPKLKFVENKALGVMLIFLFGIVYASSLGEDQAA